LSILIPHLKGFGKVYVVQDAAAGASAGRYFALKQMICQSKEQESDAHRELQTLQKFSKHDNIITLLDYASFVSKQHNNNRLVYMLFPLCSVGSAWDAVDAAAPQDTDGVPWPFPEKRALNVIWGISQALSFMHEHSFAHRDVKVRDFNYIYNYWQRMFSI
jgi:serine/threonine protein kinase